jgi:MoaA/NifB/PqqE/SkfB family radical SAM enzyme
MLKNSWPLWHWHIENSSICSLQCPRCPRNEIPDTLVQTSLGLEFFERNFNSEMLKKVWQFSFCGDDGDPIYGQEFLEVVSYLKRQKSNLSLRIVTNGSHRPASFWQGLGRALNQYDEIHFSVDGLDQENNAIYRVNSKWDSIMRGIEILRQSSPVMMTWAAIAFKHNTDKLDAMRLLAGRMGFDKFQITFSTKFGSIYSNYMVQGVDELEPSSEWVSKSQRFERTIYDLSNRKQLNNGMQKLNEGIWDDIPKDTDIIPMCQIGNKGLYISSQGYFYPCCWMANRYNHTRWNQFQSDTYNLNIRSITEVLQDPSWEEFFANLNKNTECKTKCGASNYNKDYATSW